MLQPVLLQQHSRCIGFASTSFPQSSGRILSQDLGVSGDGGGPF